jgi:hypothetical protein
MSIMFHSSPTRLFLWFWNLLSTNHHLQSHNLWCRRCWADSTHVAMSQLPIWNVHLDWNYWYWWHIFRCWWWVRAQNETKQTEQLTACRIKARDEFRRPKRCDVFCNGLENHQVDKAQNLFHVSFVLHISHKYERFEATSHFMSFPWFCCCFR